LDSTRLVIAGPPGSGSEALQNEIARLGCADRVVVTGLVDEQNLSALYAGASAFCLTSRQEGFGMPLVEAMQRGLPVVASDLPAVREVTGDAGVLVPVGDVAGFAAAFTSVLEDESLRASLASAGRGRAQLFTAARTIEGTISAYERALGAA
jgi:glycosyltransferase involved in cell wall biosynthesis